MKELWAVVGVDEEGETFRIESDSRAQAEARAEKIIENGEHGGAIWVVRVHTVYTAVPKKTILD